MCQNSSLESLVGSVVTDFVRTGVLFTALDVSNEVKKDMPFARHREVRDLVRQAWLNEIEPAGYGRSPITVNLADGSTAEALLYHPLADSWDLDAKYDAQQRAKTAARPATTAPVTVTVGNNSVSVSDTGAIITSTQPLAVSAPHVNVAPTPVVAAANARDLWSNLFKSQPSLFPRK